MQRQILLAGLAMVLFLSSCGRHQSLDVEPISYGTTAQAIESMNGPELTGTAITEHILVTSSMYVVGSTIICPMSSCQNVEFGSHWKMKIVDISADGQYLVEYLDGGLWRRLCKLGGWAIPVPGMWRGATWFPSPSVFSFVCQDSAAYQCKMEFKYDLSQDEYQACTRMLRADYCGTGANTQSGITVDVADNLGKAWVHAGTWKPEAAWSKDGAVCIDAERFAYTREPCMIALLGACDSLTWDGTPAVLLKTLVAPSSPRGGVCSTCALGWDCHCGDVCRPPSDECP